MLPIEKLRTRLDHFHGTHEYHRLNQMFKLVATDGVAWLMKNAEAYWLFDAIGSYQPRLAKIEELREFQYWLLSVGGRGEIGDDVRYPMMVPKERNVAVLTCWRDTPKVGLKPVVRQVIEYSDFPLSETSFYLQEGVLMLPSEN